ncbi:MAG: hypothetical protein KZQ83_00860 [gamma proteobacterium symbiont of Taylorina sp.]|nr:hypothetical protein [gamma proteobacterium symbiont of Taylorina sp.]
MKQLSMEDISRLNALLDDSLNQASKEQLAVCIKLLGTSLAHLKIKYKVDENENAKDFSHFIQDLEGAQELTEAPENKLLTNEFNNLASKTIVECATAMSVAKEGLKKESIKKYD